MNEITNYQPNINGYKNLQPKTQYTCKRCGIYSCIQRIHMINHYKRQKKCPANLGDFDVEFLIDNLETKHHVTSEGKYYCNNCHRQFHNRKTKHDHTLRCKSPLTGLYNESFKCLFDNDAFIMKKIYDTFENGQIQNRNRLTAFIEILKYIYFNKKDNPYNINHYLEQQNSEKVRVFIKETNSFEYKDRNTVAEKLLEVFKPKFEACINKMKDENIIDRDTHDFYDFYIVDNYDEERTLIRIIKKLSYQYYIENKNDLAYDL